MGAVGQVVTNFITGVGFSELGDLVGSAGAGPAPYDIPDSFNPSFDFPSSDLGSPVVDTFCIKCF